MRLLAGLIALGLPLALALGQNSGVEAPVVTGGGEAFKLSRPEMYRPGWNDLNKNGRQDRFEDPSQPVEQRVEDLLRQMTREERIGQLLQRSLKGNPEGRDAKLLAAGGLGSYLGAAADARMRDRLQRRAVEESRLGVPLIFGFDTIHGFRTIFPIPLALSASWEPALVEQVSAVAAAESAAAGIDWVFAPMVDVARDPRWGRMAEGTGEDPWLGCQMAAAAVRGFQGTNYGQPERVAACLKHYVGYGAAEGGRDYNTTEIGLPTLRNIYLPPFKAGVDAGAATLMSAFNCVSGVPASANRFTLDQVLRREWQFQGFVVSDWDAVGQLVNHGYAADQAEATAMALSAGIDMEMVSECYRKTLSTLIEQGKLPEAALDTAVRRILRVKLQKGLFERPYTPALTLDAEKSRALAREAVARCCVLLKNQEARLPLRPKATVALLGPMSENQGDMLGCWSALGRKEDVVTLKQGLAAALPAAKLLLAEGCGLTDSNDQGLERAVATARQADVVVLALGEPRTWSGEAKSRCELGLPGVQRRLFEAVVATGKPVVTVLFAGRPLAIPEVLANSAAVLMAWHPGVQAGAGVADVLAGQAEPSGRLTATFPRTVGQVPVHYNFLATSRPRQDYVDGARAPLLPFGFGLSYTQFKYGPTRLSAPSTADRITAVATVANTGPRAGTEVVQLYLRDVACSWGARPLRELKGFERVSLQPGQSQEVAFTLSREQLGCWSAEGKWVVEPGQFEITIAPNAASGMMVPFTLSQ